MTSNKMAQNEVIYLVDEHSSNPIGHVAADITSAKFKLVFEKLKFSVDSNF